MRPRFERKKCSVEDCTGITVGSRGYCSRHYQRWLKYNDPLGGGRDRRPTAGVTMEEAFRWFMPGDPPPAPSPTEGCWDWTGSLSDSGYGNFGGLIDGKVQNVKAHVAAYRIFHGPIPHGGLILHSCDRPPCCQPAHLRAGTHWENVADSVQRGRLPVGEAHSRAKFTEADVRMIRESPLSGPKLAKEFGVHYNTILAIRRGTSWKHVK